MATRNRQRRHGQTAEVVLFIVTAMLLAVSAVLMAVFGADVMPAGYREFSREITEALAATSAVVPVAIWDILLIALFVVSLVTLIYCLWRRRDRALWLAINTTIVAAIFLVTVVVWGLNFYSPPLSDTVGLRVKPITQQSLIEATDYYWDQAAELAGGVPRNEDGTLQDQDFYELAAIAGTSYEKLAEVNDIFSGSTKPAKPLTVLSTGLLYTGGVNLYSPLSGEALISQGGHAEDLPYEMCHGVAHRLGIADEDEADFAAFLACTHSDDKRFAYSGYCAAFETCYEALQTYCPDVAATYTDGADTMHTLVLNDIEAANAYYETYEGLFTRVGSIAKELYLRAFLSNAGKNLSDSTVSYLIAWHEATAAPQTANVDSGVNQ